MRVPGPLIVLEGVDGCGSTTQTRRLQAALQNQGHDVVTTCQPSAGPIGSLIRTALRGELPSEGSRSRIFDWTTLALLFAADRLDHWRQLIEPALAAGRVVLCDRYDLSSLAYQSATAPADAKPVPWVRTLNAFARRPDLTLVVNVRPETAEHRRAVRGGPAELFESRDLQRRLCALYARAETLVPGDRLVHVSGEGREDQVTDELLIAIESSGILASL